MNIQNKLTTERRNEFRKKSKLLEPNVRIGKNGLTEDAIAHIKFLLKEKKLIKIKMLKSFIEDYNKKQVARDLAGKTDSTLIDQIGHTVVLWKR